MCEILFVSLFELCFDRKINKHFLARICSHAHNRALMASFVVMCRRHMSDTFAQPTHNKRNRTLKTRTKQRKTQRKLCKTSTNSHAHAPVSCMLNSNSLFSIFNTSSTPCCPYSNKQCETQTTTSNNTRKHNPTKQNQTKQTHKNNIPQ